MRFLGYNINISKAKNCRDIANLAEHTFDARDIFARNHKIINTSTVEGQTLAIAKCPVLTSILALKVRAILDARFWLQNQQGEDVESDVLREIMVPNTWQSLQEFTAMAAYFSQIYGKAYICNIKGVGIDGVGELFVIPNNLVTENQSTNQETSFAPQSNIEDYTVALPNGVTLRFGKEDIYIVRDSLYSLNVLGDTISRLVSLSEPINTYIAAAEASSELLINRGMLGIISLTSDLPPAAMQAMPATQRDKEELQAQLNKYGVVRGTMKYAITQYRASYVPVSANIKDLGAVATQMSCKKDIAYAYNVPAVMLDIADSTFANYNEARRHFYSSEILPLANSVTAVLSRVYNLPSDIKIVATFDHIDIFQQAKREQALGLERLASALISLRDSGLISDEGAKVELNKYLA